ncbi:ABC transporter ATP-binding protein [Catenulispora subtropica]
MEQDGAVVALIGVRRVYGAGESRVAALDGVSLAFPEGSFTAIMGPSGSGKSTLLQCAAGLDRVDKGRVRLAGADPAGLSETALTKLRRERVGFVFQSFNLLPTLTARQNVEFPLRLAKRRPEPSEVDGVLADFGLAARACPGTLLAAMAGTAAAATQATALRRLVGRPAVVVPYGQIAQAVALCTAVAVTAAVVPAWRITRRRS